jgi:trans-2,3-dihydro-3-hydroxyanthranilic acid synthase
MPATAELPPNIARWNVDSRRSVLLVHDMQRYFLAPFAEQESPRADLVRNLTALRRQCAESGVPVVFTAQPGDMTPRQRGLLQDFWGRGMSAAPGERALIDGLAPAGDTVLTKWRYSAFHGSGLLDHLRGLGRDQLIICGVYAHLGCLITAYEAFSHDIQPFFVADAVADFSRSYHDMALTLAAESCAAVTTTAAVVARLADQNVAA